MILRLFCGRLSGKSPVIQRILCLIPNNKSENKFLALNLYNLIPVCRSCNSTYKLDDNTPVVNPYIDELGENIKFSLNNLDIPNYMTHKKIHLNINCYSQNARNHIDILKIKDFPCCRNFQF